MGSHKKGAALRKNSVKNFGTYFEAARYRLGVTNTPYDCSACGGGGARRWGLTQHRVRATMLKIGRMRVSSKTVSSIMNRVQRPWGSFVILHNDPAYVVKQISVLPGRRLSLQSHAHRSESWTIVSGEALITLGEVEFVGGALGQVFIPCGVKHRIKNTSEHDDLVIVEVQLGTVLDEADIVRYEDDYQRS